MPPRLPLNAKMYVGEPTVLLTLPECDEDCE
ncbi:hypothetical protein DR64_7259 [Paraburkholderia xenovorans LB400]|nr:hypothetical protein DR64_7259 [Paraburkholderia xenovorans LB400]